MNQTFLNLGKFFFGKNDHLVSAKDISQEDNHKVDFIHICDLFTEESVQTITLTWPYSKGLGHGALKHFKNNR